MERTAIVRIRLPVATVCYRRMWILEAARTQLFCWQMMLPLEDRRARVVGSSISQGLVELPGELPRPLAHVKADAACKFARKTGRPHSARGIVYEGARKREP